MISPDYDFTEFANAVRGKDFLDVICLAEKEATAAWRQARRNNGHHKVTPDQSQDYQTKLIGLISYMRQAIKPSGYSDNDFQLFDSIRAQSSPK